MSFWFCESEGFDAPSWSLKECAIDYDRLVVAFWVSQQFVFVN